MGADSGAILALAAVPDFVFSGAVKAAGAVNNGPGTQMQQSPLEGVFMAAPVFARGGVVPELFETDIPPLVAALLGVSFPCPDGKLVPGIMNVSAPSAPSAQWAPLPAKWVGDL